MIKKTIEEVKNYFAVNGCKLLENEYVNSKTKMQYECVCGNVAKINFNHFSDGKRCWECGRKKILGSFRFSLQEVKDIFFKEGSILLENQYINNHTLMNYVCRCGFPSRITLMHFQEMKKCELCRSSQKFNIEFVRLYFKENGCELLENKYVNNATLMNYKCKCGNLSKITFANFKNGKRCKNCGKEKQKISSKLSYEEVQNRLTKNGFTLLESEYKNARQHLRYKCLCGNVSKIRLSSFKEGQKCKKCGIKEISGEKSHWWNPDREQIAINYIFRIRCRSMLQRVSKYLKEKKTKSTFKTLGYKWEDLKSHIESHINWKRVCNTKWEIDHIFPIQAFINYGIKNIKLINSLENLQPLTEDENNLKSDCYDKQIFECWLKSKNIMFQSKIQELDPVELGER